MPINLMTALDSAESETVASGTTASMAIEDKIDGDIMGTRRGADDEEQSAGKQGEEEIPIVYMHGITINEVDQMIGNDFGDHVHRNDGTSII
jgi:hypothetical protein